MKLKNLIFATLSLVISTGSLQAIPAPTKKIKCWTPELKQKKRDYINQGLPQKPNFKGLPKAERKAKKKEWKLKNKETRLERRKKRQELKMALKACKGKQKPEKCECIKKVIEEKTAS